MKIDLVIESPTSTSTRARQVSSMFDAPPQKKARLEWHLDIDLESAPWNVGLVVGPSGSGKTSVMRHVWGDPREFTWTGAGVVDDFDRRHSVEDVAGVCQAVGFNTIPAWMRPFAVLSNGERFRVELARRLLEVDDPIVVDEFSSVVDRQVAQIASHAVQKFIRRAGRRFVAVGCHYDVIDWLQPDWVLDMATQSFTRRLLQRRPTIECVIGRLPHSAWAMFAPYHYLTASLHRGARGYGLWAAGRLAASAWMLQMPVSRGDRNVIYRCTRLVTLPDWQGVGLAMALIDVVGAAYKAAGRAVRTYPAHPALVRTFDRSSAWTMTKRPGRYAASLATAAVSGIGGRPCATFEYVGQPATSRLLGV